MRYMQMSFSDELINVVPYRPVLVRAHATRHPIPWCPAQHQQQSATRTRREEGRLLDPASKPQGHRPVGPQLRPLRGSHHIHGARVGRTNHGSTRPGEKNGRHGQLLTIIAAGPPPLTSPHRKRNVEEEDEMKRREEEKSFPLTGSFLLERGRRGRTLLSSATVSCGRRRCARCGMLLEEMAV
jgi:hypothetical protein